MKPWRYAASLDRSSLIRGASPLGLPDTRSRAPLRRRAPLAWLARPARSQLGIGDRFMRQLLVSSGGLRPPDPLTGSLAGPHRPAPLARLPRSRSLALSNARTGL